MSSSGHRPPWVTYEQRTNARQSPPVDMPPDYAVIRPDGAIRQWGGALWHWDEAARAWHLIDDLL